MRILAFYLFVFNFLLLFSTTGASGQQRTQVEIIHADMMEFDEKKGKKVRKLTGNVKFRQNDMLLSCDSAFQYIDENKIDAFGNVRILQADTLEITGDVLKYNGNTRHATMTGDVVLKDNTMVLRTDKLNYDLKERIATYTTGATITSEDNILRSERGYYHSTTKHAYFRRKVSLENPDFILTTDTLRFHTGTEVATFFGPTHIVSKENTIYCENGWYDTQKDKAFFSQNVILENPPKTVFSDTIFYDRNTGIGRGYSNVTVIDTAKNMIIHSHQTVYNEKTNAIMATRQAIMVNISGSDSLYINADTLRSVEDSLGMRTLFAYKNVRIFRTNLQGVSDSLVYSDQDSLLKMYHHPVMWNDSSQFSSDTIYLVMENNSLKRMYLQSNAFIATMQNAGQFDQVKAAKITGFVEQDTLRSMLAEGNVESIYFVKEDDGSYTGVNQSSSTRMRILLDDGQIDRIISYGPEGGVNPLSGNHLQSLKLEGLYWQDYRRPDSKEYLLTEPVPFRPQTTMPAASREKDQPDQRAR